MSVLRSSNGRSTGYELVYILPAETTEQQVAELHEQILAVVSRMSGQIEDCAFHDLEAAAVDPGVIRQYGEVLRRRLDRDRLVRAIGRT